MAEENLFPEDELEEEETEDEDLMEEELEEEEEPVGYKESVYFSDDGIGDIVRDGQYRLKSATRLEAYEQWCINCLMTERDKYPCYGETFGIATEEAMQAESREQAESILTLEITEALTNDPYERTEYVDNIEFDWDKAPDAVSISLTVHGIEDVTLDITVIVDPRVR